jgi:site-specific recombinase XerD
MFQKLEQKVILSGLSRSTLYNYGRSIAQIALHFRRLPLDLSDETINEYLLELKAGKNPSESYFKHTVYGLRYLFRLFEREDRAISLPPIARSKTLPVILNREEVLTLLKTPKLLKHRILLGLTYASGLRLFEVQALRIADIDFVRKTVFVRRGKNGKSRYVPLEDHILRGIKKYLSCVHPRVYLFEGQSKGKAIAKRGIQHLCKAAVKKSGLTKAITLHTLRHSYATHFLEDTSDLFTLKENLGHARIETTLIYVHTAASVARFGAYSPLSKVMDLAKGDTKNS